MLPLVITQGYVLLLLIKEAKRTKRKSQAKVAHEMGFHPKYLSELTNQVMLPIPALEKASEHFGCPPELFDIGQVLSEIKDIKRVTGHHTEALEICRERLSALEDKNAALTKEVEALKRENMLLSRSDN